MLSILAKFIDNDVPYHFLLKSSNGSLFLCDIFWQTERRIFQTWKLLQKTKCKSHDNWWFVFWIGHRVEMVVYMFELEICMVEAVVCIAKLVVSTIELEIYMVHIVCLYCTILFAFLNQCFVLRDNWNCCNFLFIKDFADYKRYSTWSPFLL